MGDGFFCTDGAERKGPVDAATLRRLVADGKIAGDAPVLREGVDTPLPAHAAIGFVGAEAPRPPGILKSIGIRLSALAGVPVADDVPVG